MDKVYVKGQKLFITTEEATYDGTFHSMDKERNRLTIKDVVKHPSEESFDGLFHFYRSEIRNVQIMDPLTSAWLTPGTEIVGNKHSSIMKGVQAPHTATRMPHVIHAQGEISEDVYKYYLNLLKTIKTIDDVSDSFDQAMCDIMSHSIVGVSSEGTLLGRKGKLSWISVCCPELDGAEKGPPHSLDCPSHVKLYLFDIALMGAVAFNKGLKNFLENEDSPRKVIHDCRLLSDCLYNQFDVKLQNVLDTQVAECIIRFPRMRVAEDKGMDKLVFTRSLNSCLGFLFGLPSTLLYQPNINDGFIQKNLEIWYQRPITPLMAKALTFKTIYLIHLWKKMSHVESLPEFKSGVQIFLSCVKDADDDTAFLMTNQYHLMPKEFIPTVLDFYKKNPTRNYRERNRYVRFGRENGKPNHAAADR